MEIKFDKKQKIIGLCIFLFLIIDTALLCFRYATNRYSKALLSFENSVISGEKMRALNSSASASKISKPGYAWYKFTPEEKKLFEEYYSQLEATGVSVRLAVKNVRGEKFQNAVQEPKLFYFGFLTEEDFTEKGKFQPVEKRILSGCDLRSFIKNSKGFSFFDNSLALDKNLRPEQLPCGFVIYSQYPVKIVDFLAGSAKVGFDLTGEIPFYGVSSNGGSFAGSGKNVDFSGSSSVFPVENTRYSIMPVINISFTPSENYGTSDKQLSVKINAGGDKITFLRSSRTSDYIVQTSTLLSPFSYYEITENEELLEKLIMSSNDRALLPEGFGVVTTPLKTDPGLILSSRQNTWRTPDYEVYEWAQFPGILFFDTKDYKVQGDFFTRLAFFVEKTGFRGKILSDEELGDMHGYNAHDYGAEGLASFFSKAEVSGVKLTEKELILKDILLKKGIIVKDQSGYLPGKGAVISISRESPGYLRQSFIAHESWHGIFFTDEEFRNTVAAVYYTVDSTTMAFLKGYWKSQPGLGYDSQDDFLMKNEFMAYLMQQPLNSVSKYFIHLASRGSVMNYQQELCDWVKRTQGRTFEDACRVLDSYAFDTWGLASGRVSLILR